MSLAESRQYRADPRFAGATNLLVDCAGARPGRRLLFVNESGTAAVARGTIAYLEAEARRLGADVDSIWVAHVAGADQIPDAVIDAISAAEVTIFSHTLGAMLRVRPIPGNGVGVLNYATTDAILTSDWVRVPYGVWQEIGRYFAAELGRSARWEINCPAGTRLRGRFPPPAAAPAAGNADGFSLNTFPIGTHQPASAAGATGVVAIRWLVSSQNHDVGDGISLANPILAVVNDGRIVDFEGASDDAARVRGYLEEIGTRYRKDPFLINSWHGGINPRAFTPRPQHEDLAHWQTLVHNNPRSLHFHVVGTQVPGELSLPIIDAAVVIDGRTVWDKGDLAVLKHPEARAIAARWRVADTALELNPAIGL